MLKSLFQGNRAMPDVVPAPPVLGLEPYTGPWTIDQAAHLLRRSMYGPTYENMKWSADQGLQGTIDQLFAAQPMPAPPVNSHGASDGAVAPGETWINAPYQSTAALSYRSKSLFSWVIGLAWTEGVSIREKMTLFWHNHFPINSVLDPKFLYRYLNLLRQYATGNFLELTKRMTIDPAMLRFLDGHSNHKSAPNENYARELLELFTIGKGPQIGPGDYSNYTEQDVMEIARALTGWQDYGFTTSSGSSGDIGATFHPERHDTGDKVLSYHFNHVVISNMGQQEYAHVIDIIFQQQEVARYISRRLYQWFVYYEITDEVEVNVIEPMAQIIWDNNFEIEPALRALLSSQHFFDMQYAGVMIKNPLDFTLSILKTLQVDISQELDKKYDSWYSIYGYINLMQLSYFQIPEVAGWKAYYLEPLYFRNWISATTLPYRMSLAHNLVYTGVAPFSANGQWMRVDTLKLLDTLENPSDPNDVVAEITRLLLPRPLLSEQYDQLKDVLLNGLPDFEWTVEFNMYQADPGNSSLGNALGNKIRNLIGAVLSLPEFYLS